MRAIRRDHFERIKILFMLRRNVLKGASHTPEWEYMLVGAMAMACYVADLAEGSKIEVELHSDVMRTFNTVWVCMTEDLVEQLNALPAFRDLVASIEGA